MAWPIAARMRGQAIWKARGAAAWKARGAAAWKAGRMKGLANSSGKRLRASIKRK